MRRAILPLALLLAAFSLRPMTAQPAPHVPGQDAAAPQPDAITTALAGVQAAVTSRRIDAFQALTADALSPAERLGFELTLFGDDITNAVMRERDRQSIEGAPRVLVEFLIDRGGSGQIFTWQISFTSGPEPRIIGLKEISAISGLRRLELDTSAAFAVNNFSFTATDFRLTMSSGVAFVGRTEEGVTAIVLRGKGRVEFSPFDPIERHQMVRFAKSESLVDGVDSVFIRLHPAEYATRIAEGSLTPIAAAPRDIGRAQSVFDQWAGQSYNVALGDLSAERWSLLPPIGDALADVHTDKRGWLSYARAGNQPEDVSFFDRAARKNISIYASPAKLATRGRFYSEDTDRVYDVEHYDVSTRFINPERNQLSGTTTLKLKLLQHDVGTITLKLADSLAVSSVTSANFGRLLQLRIVGQNSLLVSLPEPQPAGTVITLTIAYAGRLAPQSLTRETAAVAAVADIDGQSAQTTQDNPILPEPNYAYSVNSYWYPQALVTDYATAEISVTVPEAYQAVASGTFQRETLTGTDRVETFAADVPARYLAVVVSRLAQLPRASITTSSDATLAIDAWASPRAVGGARSLAERAAGMMKFYASMIGSVPYPSFTLLALESDLPGGHSPPYIAAINQPTPTTIFSWRNDPIAFDDQFPDFFLAHEVAHQWWGQAVGTKNYHEQWLSEGLAQYFAYLYAGHERGPGPQRNILERMKQSVRRFDSSGPISLGYRLGHAVGDGTNYRAIVYNKSVVVLDMLRQFIGDDAFAAGLRRFYDGHRNQKAGTDDLRLAFEAESKEPLARFFDRWVLDSGLPTLKFTAVVETNGQAARVRIEQIGPVFDLPATVAILYEDRPTEYVTLKVRGAVTEARIPLSGRLRKDGVRLQPPL